MEYRYHVDLTRNCGNAAYVHTRRYEHFSDAFAYFVYKCNTERTNNACEWSVVLYDMELCDIKCRVDSTDFE